MTAPAAAAGPGPVARAVAGAPPWAWPAGLALAAAAAGFALAPFYPPEAWLLAVVTLAGLAAGGLGLLAIGHVMGEAWLAPVRSEAEAAALTAPLVLVLALPLAPALDRLYPWAAGAAPDLPPALAAFLDPALFRARAALYLALWTALALWLARARDARRAGGFALAALLPTVSFAANEWVLSREPPWWSSLFGLGFATCQLLAALAGAILVSLLRPERPTAARMQALERALLTLALLALWVWFVRFLVAWLANLPEEAAWYLARAEGGRLRAIAVALAALLAAVVLLVPPGVGRRPMIAGSALLLVGHAAHTAWILPPVGPGAGPARWLAAAAVLLGLGAVWAVAFRAAVRGRPNLLEETAGGPDPPGGSG